MQTNVILVYNIIVIYHKLCQSDVLFYIKKKIYKVEL